MSGIMNMGQERAAARWDVAAMRGETTLCIRSAKDHEAASIMGGALAADDKLGADYIVVMGHGIGASGVSIREYRKRLSFREVDRVHAVGCPTCYSPAGWSCRIREPGKPATHTARALWADEEAHTSTSLVDGSSEPAIEVLEGVLEEGDTTYFSLPPGADLPLAPPARAALPPPPPVAPVLPVEAAAMVRRASTSRPRAPDLELRLSSRPTAPAVRTARELVSVVHDSDGQIVIAPLAVVRAVEVKQAYRSKQPTLVTCVIPKPSAEMPLSSRGYFPAPLVVPGAPRAAGGASVPPAGSL